jgi:hypothetical protein
VFYRFELWKELIEVVTVARPDGKLPFRRHWISDELSMLPFHLERTV